MGKNTKLQERHLNHAGTVQIVATLPRAGATLDTTRPTPTKMCSTATNQASPGMKGSRRMTGNNPTGEEGSRTAAGGDQKGTEDRVPTGLSADSARPATESLTARTSIEDFPQYNKQQGFRGTNRYRNKTN